MASVVSATVSLAPYTADETRDPQRRWTEGARVDRATIADVPHVDFEGATPERFVAARDKGEMAQFLRGAAGAPVQLPDCLVVGFRQPGDFA